MNRTRLLLIGFVALALGAFVAFAVYKNLLAKSGTGNEPGIDVALAANDLKVGDKLEERDIRVARVPVWAESRPWHGASSSRVVGSGGSTRPVRSREACRRTASA